MKAAQPKPEKAIIIGVGDGLSASLARLFHKNGIAVSLASRQPENLTALCAETDAQAFACDVSDAKSVEKLFAATDNSIGSPDIVVFNPSARTRGPFIEQDTDAVRQAILVSCYGGFLVAQAAAKRMLTQGHGSILFTGASASVKGYAQSASFAMGKFGLRGLAQSLARELHPQGIHIGHFVIDGGISSGAKDPRAGRGGGEDGLLHPDAIAESYLNFHRQHRSSWAWEIELRPWVEKF
jgi:NAD(P)-dependent dehydrogenase (short-subunit alcohol dehydrogenase family)